MSAKTAKQVLVVDNNDEERANLAAQLRQLGHDSTTTWSGSEALNLLKTKKFDILLVEDYLADMYIGDFLDRVTRAGDLPRIWVMQTAPVHPVNTYGSKSYPVVAKRHLAKLFAQLNGGTDGSVSGTGAWKH